MTTVSSKQGFGTAPVFMATISTILGAILFLRFGYAVAQVGFWGTVGIILIGHIVTIATAFAVAEIATNQKVEGGGAYYIISRSFGLNIGAAIGVALFLAQAISLAFYIIAFGEAFDPVIPYLQEEYGLQILDKRLITLPTIGLLTLLILTKGANVGVKALYFVVAILFVSLIFFMLGDGDYESTTSPLVDKLDNPDSFFYVFAIIFPAFTGIAAGLGLSGDLKNPKKAIPIGTMSATLAGMVIYIFIAYKLAVSASPEDLNADQLIMSKIAIWGPIIPIGLACACISSALGSILIAPRTLQALAQDDIFPTSGINKFLSFGRKRDKEPIAAAIVTVIISIFFILIDDINIVAEIISMFFMVTYGAICLISFLEHFAADPAYRPSFKSKWYISLIGAVSCIWLMFQMNAQYAAISILIMGVFYFVVSHYSDGHGLANIFKGLIFQVSRQLQLFLQKRDKENAEDENWRPFAVCISRYSFQRLDAFELMRWIANRYGFGTYIHYIEGYLSKATSDEAKTILERLVIMSQSSHSKVILDTIISPSYTSAIAQVVQIPGISGKDNNMIIFEYSKSNPANLGNIIDNYNLVNAAGFDVCILASSERGFGYHQEMHIWMTSNDYENGNLMILLSYIILGHKDWSNGIIKIFAVYPQNELQSKWELISKLVKEGRLPISLKNIELIAQPDKTDVKTVINEKSAQADLTIVGFRSELLKRKNKDLFKDFDNLGNVLFVNTTLEKEIK